MDSSSPGSHPTAPAAFGTRAKRLEDPRFVSGAGRYLDDLALPTNTLHMRLVRSEFARAQLKSVAFYEDAEPPVGSHLVTGDAVQGLGIGASGAHETWQESSQPLLAHNEVRFAGEPVAAVLHADPYLAEDAADLVAVDYEPADPIVDLADAMQDTSKLVHSGWRDNLFVRRLRSYGDLAAARAEATHVIKRVFRTNRQAGVPLENCGCLAIPDGDGRGVTLWSSTQVPHLVRTYVAKELGIAESFVKVIAPDVGGGFGVKGHVFAEEVLTAALALQFGRPVKWTEDRLEHLVSSIHARDHLHLLEAYTDDRGRVLGLKAQLVVDAGAYGVYPWTAGVDSGMASRILLGPYTIRHYEVEDITVATNKCPLGTYRGVARPSAVFSMERLMDEIARTLGMDPLDVRRENVIREFPYETANGLLYDPGSYAESLELAVEKSGYVPRQHRTDVSPPASRVRRGYGVALFNEQTAHGTRYFAGRGRPIETGYESLFLRVEPDGMVLATTGLQSHGQGMETTLAQIISDELGLPMSSIRLLHGDTSNSPYCVGTWGSRGATLGGGAAAVAARKIREKVLTIAAHRLEVAPEDLQISQGVISVSGVPEPSITFAEVAYIANRSVVDLPPEMSPGLEATTYIDGPDQGTFSNACHIAIVDVDTLTGIVTVDRYIVVEDCGSMINPMIVDGQIHGGVAQGIGSALLEEVVYSGDGQQTTSTFMDYLLPTSTVVPDVEVHHLVTPSPWTERGMKGMGESGAIGPMAAIANAVSDALQVPVHETPMRPRRVWRLINVGQDLEGLWQHWSQHPCLSEFWDEPSINSETASVTSSNSQERK